MAKHSSGGDSRRGTDLQRMSNGSVRQVVTGARITMTVATHPTWHKLQGQPAEGSGRALYNNIINHQPKS